MNIYWQPWFILAIPIIVGHYYKVFEKVLDLKRFWKEIPDNVRTDRVQRVLAGVLSGVLNHHIMRIECGCEFNDWQSIWIIGTSAVLTGTTFYKLFDYEYAISIGKKWHFLGTTKAHDRKLSRYNKWLILSAKILLFLGSITLTLISWGNSHI